VKDKRTTHSQRGECRGESRGGRERVTEKGEECRRDVKKGPSNRQVIFSTSGHGTRKEYEKGSHALRDRKLKKKGVTGRVGRKGAPGQKVQEEGESARNE